MIEVKGIKSETRPVDIDDFSSDTTVYMRYNIEETTETDPVFNTEKVVYVYDETQYTMAEWYRLSMSEAKAKIALLEESVKILGRKLEVWLPL